MSEHAVTRLPERILSKTADVKLLGDILAEFNPDAKFTLIEPNKLHNEILFRFSALNHTFNLC